MVNAPVLMGFYKELLFVGADLCVRPLGGRMPVKPYLGTGFSMGSILSGFLRKVRRDFSASQASSREENGPSQT
jgi:hypothetical protein